MGELGGGVWPRSDPLRNRLGRVVAKPWWGLGEMSILAGRDWVESERRQIMGSRGVGIGGSVRGVGSLKRGLPLALLILPALLQVTSALPEVIKLGRLAVLVLHPSTFYNHLCWYVSKKTFSQIWEAGGYSGQWYQQTFPWSNPCQPCASEIKE